LLVGRSPDGRWGATGSGERANSKGGTSPAGFDYVIRLFDLETGKELRQFKKHTSSILSLVFSTDSRYLLSGSGDATLRLWRLTK